jgi:hypothetical protein
MGSTQKKCSRIFNRWVIQYLNKIISVPQESSQLLPLISRQGNVILLKVHHPQHNEYHNHELKIGDVRLHDHAARSRLYQH